MTERRCEYCGKALRPDARSNQRYCGRTHKRQARRQVKRREEQHAERVTRYPQLADVSLTEMYDKAGPPPRPFVSGDEDFVMPDVEPDEFGMTDGLLDNPDPGKAWTKRQEVEQQVQTIRARYAPEIHRWQKVYARNPGPTPRLDEISRKMAAEIRRVESTFYKSEALELAARDQASGRARTRAAERQKATQNLNDFGRDLRGSRFQPVRETKETSEIFQFGEPGNVFGNDSELFSKSGVAQRIYQSNPYVSPDGFV